MKWRQCALGELLRIKHGWAFKGEFFSETGKYIVLTPGNFNEKGGFRVRPGKDRAYSGNFPEAYILKEGDVILAMTEQAPGLLGCSALVPESDRFLHNQRLGLVQPMDETLIDKKFIYHLFNTSSVRGQISASASGTKVRHTAPERIARVIVKIPNILSQRKIAASISAYDDLIENNRRRIALLEQAARLLYKEWFIYLRFPGHEHVKVKAGVPKGWEKRFVGDLVDYLNRGITPIYDDDAPGIVINQKCIRDRLLNLDLARHQSKEVPKDKLVRSGDVLINSTGEGTLGRITQIISEIENCTVDSHVTIARPSAKIGKHYFGMCLMSMESYLGIMGRGATNQTELSRATISEIAILIPPKTIQQEFEDLALSVYRQIENLTNQNKKLVQARDLLLPRLMNGEIVV